MPPALLESWQRIFEKPSEPSTWSTAESTLDRLLVADIAAARGTVYPNLEQEQSLYTIMDSSTATRSMRATRACLARMLRAACGWVDHRTQQSGGMKGADRQWIVMMGSVISYISTVKETGDIHSHARQLKCTQGKPASLERIHRLIESC